MRAIFLGLALAALSGPTFAQTPDAGHTPEFTPFTGGGPAVSETQAMLNGKPVTLVRITAYYHQMDLPPHSAQPIGLEYFKYFVKDSGQGNITHCEKWVKKIQADEAAWTKRSSTFPYLEINIANGAKPVTVNGQLAYKPADVLCWEAMDFGPALY